MTHLKKLTGLYSILSRKEHGRLLIQSSKYSSAQLAISEPPAPIIKTEIPGPRSLQLLKELDDIQHTHTIQFFVDYEKSYGNYIVDADDNHILDLYTQIASTPLGYNHPKLVEAFKKKSNMAHFINRPALGNLPPKDWGNKLKNTLIDIAPYGLKNVQTMACGTCSNEQAFKAAFMAYMRKQRKGKPYTEEDFSSCVDNQEPGSPPLTVLSFDGAFHGRTMAVLTCSHSKWQHKLDFPVADWPIAPFPKLKYPLSMNEEHNKTEEANSLEQVKNKILEYNSKGKPVAAIVVEPIQCEGGDRYASPDFFQKLQKICKELGSYLIIDEVQSGGGGTGLWWWSESFNLPEPPDALVFSKKALTGGFYHTDELRPQEGGRIFNTWMGDPSRLLLLEYVVNVVKENNLLEKIKDVGRHMVEGLENLQDRYPDQISAARGHGSLIAIDINTPQLRDQFITDFKRKGIHLGGCGYSTLRLRTALIFENSHADYFLNAFDEILKDNS